MQNKAKRLYACFGSNLFASLMKQLCPGCSIFGSGTIKGYGLRFHGVANIVPSAQEEVPVGIWEIDRRGEKALDKYESSEEYEKINVEVCMQNSEIVNCITYVAKNAAGEFKPSRAYLSKLRSGYEVFSLDQTAITDAISRITDR